MKNVVGISEIVLWTADKERALRFYRDLLALEVISPPTLPNTFLKAGEGNAERMPCSVHEIPSQATTAQRSPRMLTPELIRRASTSVANEA